MTRAHGLLRPEPFPQAPRASAARIAAWSGAFAVNGLVLGWLLLPIAAPLAPPRLEQVLEALWIEAAPVIEAQPLPPVPQPPVVPVRRAQPKPAVVETAPVPVDVAPATAVEPALPGDSVSAPVDGHGGADEGQLAYVDAPPPPYPRDALRKHLQGTVLLEVLVDAQGLPRAVTLARSSGHAVLDAAARRHVLKHWRFRPAIRDGQAIPARGLVPVRFAIASG